MRFDREAPGSPAPRLVAIVAALVVAALGVLYFAGGSLGAFDGQAEPMDGLQGPWRGVALVVDFCGEPAGSTVLTVVVVLTCLLLRRFRLAGVAVVGIALTVASTTVLKPVVDRTIHGDYLSYPSGHTAFATSLALILAALTIDVFRLTRGLAILVTLAMVIPAGTTMGWAEVMLSAHYPTDAVGGFFTALAAVPAAAWLFDRITSRLPRRRSATPPKPPVTS